MGVIFYLTIFMYGVTAQNGPDITPNKPVSQSSTYNNKNSRYGPQFAVNGLAVCDTEYGPVALTELEQEPWWQIDLQGKYYIRTVTVLPRTYNPSQSRNFNIFYKEPYDDATKCNHNGNRDGHRGPDYTCNQIGNVVRIRRWKRSYQLRLSVCQVQVFGDEVCDNERKYGPNCEFNCSWRCTAWCRKRDGWCPGMMECPPRYYGEWCNGQCSIGCNTTACHIVDGWCQCKDGWWGWQCTSPCGNNCKRCNKDSGSCLECVDGYYGTECNSQCSLTCNTTTCRIDDGQCSGCLEGYYGLRCEKECSTHCKHTSCSKQDGRCKCQVGSSGHPCTPCPSNCTTSGCNDQFICEECPARMYGDYCNLTCSINCIATECNRNGSCECKPGYAGIGCLPCPGNCVQGCNGSLTCTSCKSGYYGPFCNQACIGNCEGNSCSRNQGICVNCTTGNFGYNCSQKCSDNCLNKGCVRQDGSCSCKPGYQGSRCPDACKEQFWGAGCNKTCHCMSGSCHHITGLCESGCAEGWTGRNCQNASPLNNPSNTGVIAGGAVAGAVFVLICLIILFLLIIRRRRSAPERTKSDAGCHEYSEVYDNKIIPEEHQYVAIDNITQEKQKQVLKESIPLEERITDTKDKISQDKKKPVAKDNVLLRERSSDAISGIPRDERNNLSTESGLIEKQKPASLAKLPPKKKQKEEKKLQKEPEIYMNTSTDDKIYENLSIPVSELPVYIQKMKEKGDGFHKEFKDLPTDLKYPAKLGSNQRNIKKNRFKNIIAYDHSLVKLTQLGSDANSCYVNANWILNYQNEKAFIAAQGPLKPREADFIRLIWEQNIPLIVMVTKLVENRKTKCEAYWPEDGKSTLKFAEISVSAIQDERTPHYITRKLTLTKGQEKKSLTQIQYTSWPDHGVPKSPSSFLEFHKMAQKLYKPDVGPTLVHCSAGVGRTGTFLAVDYLLKQAAAENHISVLGCVDSMRKQRSNMVQSIDQYIFLYETVMEALHCGQTSYPAATFGVTWKAIHKIQFSNQFDTLDKMKRVYKNNEFKEALKRENSGKNRNSDIVPADKVRVSLVMTIPKRNDYINAVVVNGHSKRNEFIVTQWPLSETEVDFWRLCVDYKGSSVIALNNRDKANTEYWPGSTKEKSAGPFTITKENETTENGITTRDLTCNIKNLQHKLRHFEVTVSSCNEPDIAPLLEVYENVKRWHHNTKDGCCVVHCGDGAGISGFFLALWLVCDKITDEQEVDILHAVKQIRATRPQFIINLEQYMWLHRAAEYYIDTFSSYANFK